MKSLKVLIVDDIIMNRILIKEILDELACQVAEAKNGKEAIEMLDKEKYLTPREIVAELDKYIIGQANAKKAVAIALRNRGRRRLLPDDLKAALINSAYSIGPDPDWNRDTGNGVINAAAAYSLLS